jgi:hypothetical protein
LRFLRVCFVISALSILLIKPHEAYQNFIVPSPDDYNYLANATAMVYGRFPDFTKEYRDFGPLNHAIGSSLLASPFIFGTSIIDRLAKNPIVKARTKDRLLSSWTTFGFAVATQVYLVLGALFVFLTIRDGLALPRAAAVTTITILSAGLPVYSLRRPISAHVDEFTLVAFGLYALVAALNGAEWTRPKVRFTLLTFATTGYLFLARYNDIVLAGTLAAGLLIAHRSANAWDRRRFAVAMAAVLGGLALLAFGIYSFSSMAMAIPDDRPRNWSKTLWNGWAVRRRLRWRGFEFLAERLFHVLFAFDWGLIYSAPTVLIGLAGLRHLGRAGKFLGCVAAALAVNFFMILSWGTNASYYGYRYFVYAALPFAALGLAAWWEKGEGERRNRTAALVLLTVSTTCLMLAFRAAPAYDILRGNTKWDEGRVNAHYTTNVFATALMRPDRLLRDVARVALIPMAQGQAMPVAIAKIGVMAAIPLLMGFAFFRWERRRDAEVSFRAGS